MELALESPPRANIAAFAVFNEQAGYYCPDEATTEPLVCPPGRYCPVGSSVPLSIPAGTVWSGRGTTRAGGGGGVANQQSATLADGVIALASASDAPLVAPGYYSSAGQSEPTPCGAAAFYCPGFGNSMPIIVSAGHISLPADGDEATRTDEGPCPECAAAAARGLPDTHCGCAAARCGLSPSEQQQPSHPSCLLLAAWLSLSHSHCRGPPPPPRCFAVATGAATASRSRARRATTRT